jgi:signal transduction histidine kinase
VLVELSRDEAHHVARLTVIDNGLGITADHLPHVFDRFYRADRARGRDGQAGGSGLGLSICKAIVDAHSGMIDVQSEVGLGSTFTVTLPLLAPTTGARQSETADDMLQRAR